MLPCFQPKGEQEGARKKRANSTFLAFFSFLRFACRILFFQEAFETRRKQCLPCVLDFEQRKTPDGRKALSLSFKSIEFHTPSVS